MGHKHCNSRSMIRRSATQKAYYCSKIGGQKREKKDRWGKRRRTRREVALNGLRYLKWAVPVPGCEFPADQRITKYRLLALPTNTMNAPPPARPPKVKQSMLRKIQYKWQKQKCHKSLRVTIMVSLALPTAPGASRGNCFLWVELSDHTWVMC